MNRQILHHHKYVEKRILGVSISGPKLGNYIHFHEAIELLNFWTILGKYKMMMQIYYKKSLIIFISCLFNRRISV